MEPYRFKYGRHIYEIHNSWLDSRTAKIYILNNKGERIGEVTDDDRKYKLLQLARSCKYEDLGIDKLL